MGNWLILCIQYHVIEPVIKEEVLDCQLPSKPEEAIRLIGEADRFVSRFTDKDHNDLLLVLRELLDNAITHGNGSIPEVPVQCKIRHMSEESFRITVEDEGIGFDYRRVDMGMPKDPRHARTRGYALIKALSDEIHFNEKGNRVSVVVTVH